MSKTTAFEWLIEKLKDNHNIESTELINENVLKINKKQGLELKVKKSDLQTFTVDDVRKILSEYDVDFILHTFKEPFVDGDVYEYLNNEQKTLGGFGDLMRVADKDINWPYFPPDVNFIMRGLNQHTKVSNVRRLDAKRYEISRVGLEKVIIIALNDYDLGVEAIRTAIDEFGEFHAVLKSNPNGRISSEAIEIAKSLNLKIFKWGELLGMLNLVWNWKI